MAAAATAEADAPLLAGLDNRIAELEARRRLLRRQIDALREVAGRVRNFKAGERIPTDLLLLLYLDQPSAKDTAALCNAQGWKLPGAKGPRCYLNTDVLHAVQSAVDADPLIQGMAVAKMRRAKVDLS